MYTYTHCSTASKIRGAVAGIPFETFHKYSSEIIRAGVFGRDEHGKMRERLVFPANNLVSYTPDKLAHYYRALPTNYCGRLQILVYSSLNIYTASQCVRNVAALKICRF